MTLGDKNTAATVAVRDLGAARRFYGDMLGLEMVHIEGEAAAVYRTGATTLFVYGSLYAGTNQATAVTWNVGSDIDDLVRQLRGKGVVFEHYSLPNTTLEGDVHVAGSHRIAWFTDPDGNIHSLVNA